RRRERRPEPVEVVIVEPGGADHGVDAPLGQPRQRHPGGGGDGEVDDDVDVGCRQSLQLAPDEHAAGDDVAAVVRVDGGHEVEVGVAGHRLAHRAPHAPPGADDADADRVRGAHADGGGGGGPEVTGEDADGGAGGGVTVDGAAGALGSSGATV